MKSGQPIPQGVILHLKVHGGLRHTISGLIVQSRIVGFFPHVGQPHYSDAILYHASGWSPMFGVQRVVIGLLSTATYNALAPPRPAAPAPQSPNPSRPAARTPNHKNSAASARIP